MGRKMIRINGFYDRNIGDVYSRPISVMWLKISRRIGAKCWQMVDNRMRRLNVPDVNPRHHGGEDE